MKVSVNGNKVEMTYEEICHKLGYRADVGFVEVTNRGTITFTLAKPDEVTPLLHAVVRAGMRPALSLLKCCGYSSYDEYLRIINFFEYF